MNKPLIIASLACATLFIIAHTSLDPKSCEADIYTATYPFVLPKLPYAYDDLKPHIDKKTMNIHHSKHHQTYVDNLNQALASEKALQHKTLFELLSNPDALPEQARSAILNHGGGHFNHSLFWTMMSPKKCKPGEQFAALINKQFGSFERFQEEFNAKAKTAFGSGWAWLVTDLQGNLSIITTHDQGTPIATNMRPILGLDVWEHAYYLKYQNRRPDYITAWWHVVNWPQVERYYAAAINS
jgi:Fe-Mn family superoxide dismutase